ncbi:MAG: hypothetical protein ACXW0T_05515, partial [Methylobacter sp.]
SLCSKLSKFKNWWTLPDAAKYLSEADKNEVTEADILRLALDGELKLSVRFVNQTKARRGTVVGRKDVKWGELPLDLGFQLKNYPVFERNGDSWRYMESLQIDDTQFLNISDECTTIEGVWDLPMFGCGRLNIEDKYQRLTGGPEVAFQRLGGPVVERADKGLYQLGKSCYDGLGYGSLTKAHMAKIERLELSKSTNKRKEKILMARKEQLKVIKGIEFAWFVDGTILLGQGLPEDSVLVLRTEVLTDFTQRMLDSEAEKTTATKVHRNAEHHAAKREQVVGAAFAVLAKWPEECRDAKGDPVASKIAAMIDAQAHLFWPDARPPLATDSIADHLREWIKKANSSRK